MSNEDSFINEVSEEVRRDRLYALMRRYGWIAVLAVVVLVGGAAVIEWQKSSARAEAQATGDALAAAMAEPDAEGRMEALNAIELSGAPGSDAIVLLLRAAGAAEVGDASAAVVSLDTLSGDNSAPQIYRDLAVLKSVAIGAETLTPEDRTARLQPLLQPGNPYRLLALEQRALAEIEMGAQDAAIETLTGILSDAEGTDDLRRRVSQLIVALGGELDQG